MEKYSTNRLKKDLNNLSFLTINYTLPRNCEEIVPILLPLCKLSFNKIKPSLLKLCFYEKRKRQLVNY